jgi:hypothetical protein
MLRHLTVRMKDRRREVFSGEIILAIDYYILLRGHENRMTHDEVTKKEKGTYRFVSLLALRRERAPFRRTRRPEFSSP